MERKEITAAELMYLCYFAVMFGARAVGLFEGMTVYNISLVIGMLLFAGKVLMSGHTLLEYIVAGGLLLISLIVYYNTGEKGLLLYFTMMLGLKGVSTRRVFKLGTVILSVSFSVLVFLSVTGLRQDIIYVHDRAGFGRIIRHTLGYPYPNTLFTTYIVLMVLIFYMLGKQSKRNLLLTTLLLFLGSIYIYLYSCSNTGLIVSVFYLLVNLYLQLGGGMSKFEKAGFCLIYPCCLLFSILGPLVTKGGLFSLLDRVLHNRWAYSLYYLTNEPVTLLGTRFKEAPNTNYMIDSSFLYSFLQLGLIPFVILTVLYLCTIRDLVKREKKTELAIIAGFCVLGLSDPFFFNLSYKNLMFLFVGEYYYRRMERYAEGKPALLNRKLQPLPIGNKMISYDTELVRRCGIGFEEIRKVISGNGILLTITFLVCTAAVSVILYGVTQSGYIVGRIDDVEEWEYARKVLSAGMLAGILAAAGLVGARLRRKKHKGV